MSTPDKDLPVVGWMRCHPNGDTSGEYLNDQCIEEVRKSSGAWAPLCSHTAATAIIDDLRARLEVAEAQRQAGAQLSNIAFNWAQRCGRVLTSDDCTLLDKCRKQWDAGAIDTAMKAGG